MDETGSKATTSIRLSPSSVRVEVATLALANILSQLSDAALIEVSLLSRLDVSPYELPAIPRGATRIAIPSINDCYHAVLPVPLPAVHNILPVLRQYFCTASGEDFLTEDAITLDAEPNWRTLTGVASGKYVVVLDEQLWRDLCLTSMTLDSASRRGLYSRPGAAQLRKEIESLLRGVDLNEILQRLDEIIALMQQLADGDTAIYQQVDDVEELLEAVIAAL